MKKLALMAVAATWLGACGGGGGGASNGGSPMESSLIGDWIITGTTGAVAISFDTAGGYTYAVLDVTGSASLNCQKNSGHYDANEGSLLLTAYYSSCPNDWRTATETYSVSGSQLLLTDTQGTLAFIRNTSPATTGAVLTYGCFDSTGAFTKSPYVALN